MNSKIKTALYPNQINFNNIMIINENFKYDNENLIIQTPIFENIIKINTYGDNMEIYFKIPSSEEGLNFINFILSLEKYCIKYIYDNKDNLSENININNYMQFRSLIKILNIENDKLIKFNFNTTTKIKRIHVETLKFITYNDIEMIDICNLNINGIHRIIIKIQSLIIRNNIININILPLIIEEIFICKYKFQNNSEKEDNSLSSFTEKDNELSNNINDLHIILNDITIDNSFFNNKS